MQLVVWWPCPLAFLIAVAVIGADMRFCRPHHLQHHRNTQTARDPVLELVEPFPISKTSLRRKIRRGLQGTTGCQRRPARFRQGMGEGSTREPVARLRQAEAPFLLFSAALAAVMKRRGRVSILPSAAFTWASRSF
jgi:fatty acid desaturase